MIEQGDVEHAEASVRRRAEAGYKNDQAIVHELDRLRDLVRDLEKELEDVVASLVEPASWPLGDGPGGAPITPSQLQALREALEFAIEEATFEQRWKGRAVRGYLAPKLVASALRELLAERSQLLAAMAEQRAEGGRMVWALFSDRASLSFVAELLGAAPINARGSDLSTVEDCLLRLSRHVDSMVREGAVYGLGGHLDSAVAVERLKEMAADEAPGVRAAAVEALQGSEDVAVPVALEPRRSEDELRGELADIRRAVDPEGVRADVTTAWLVEHLVEKARECNTELTGLLAKLESSREDVRRLLELQGAQV